jgi:hypothetical protein
MNCEIPSGLIPNNAQEIIDREIIEAKKNFAVLIDLVNQKYESPTSTLKDNPKQLEAFKEHNNQVLEMCIARGIEKKLNPKELKMAEIAGILHDSAKANVAPKEVKEIPNYILAAHGEIASNEVEEIFAKNPELIKTILGNKYNENEKIQTINVIKNAIKNHMGPHPGFMTHVLKQVNAELEKINQPKIEHPYPTKGEPVGEILLAADMYSLATRQGREKILGIRSFVPFFQKQDEELSKKYQEKGIDLTPGEAALLSGFDSATKAMEMIQDKKDKDWINKTIEDSKKGEYQYKDEVINYKSAAEKRNQYESK